MTDSFRTQWYCLMVVLLGSALLGMGCFDIGSHGGSGGEGAPKVDPPEASEPSADPGGAGPAPRPIVAYGDSLTTGAALPNAAPYPERVASLKKQPVVNCGVSGEGACRAKARIDSVMENNPSVVLILLGTNDVLGRHDLDNSKECLRDIVRSAVRTGARPVIATIPPMTGEMASFMPAIDYMNRHIRALAAEERILLVDLSRAFGTGEGLLLPDGYHPNETGTQLIAFSFAEAF